jgi:hypothetical protein
MSKSKKSAAKLISTDLNVDSVNQSLWLVKIPQFVAEQWTFARNNEIVGTLKVSMKSNGPGSAPTKQLNVKLQNSVESSEMPDEFTLEEVSKSASNGDSFLAFSSQTEDSKSGFSLDGKVTKNLLLKPQGTKEYRHLIRSRGISKLTSRRETHIADVIDVQRCQNQSHTVDFITSEKNELKRKSLDSRGSAGNKFAKSSSGEGDEVATTLKSAIFSSFNGSDKVLFKDILANCRGVEGFTKESDLRDMLDIYAKYTSRGQFKHLWELKPEYRDNYTASQGLSAVEVKPPASSS